MDGGGCRRMTKWTSRLLTEREQRSQMLSLGYDSRLRFQDQYWELPCRSFDPCLSSRKELCSFILWKTLARPQAICFRLNLLSASPNTLNSDTSSSFKEWPSVMARVTRLRTDCYSSIRYRLPVTSSDCYYSVFYAIRLGVVPYFI